MDDNARTVPNIALPADHARPRGFISLRWRILTPVLAVLMAASMCGVYGVAYAVSVGSGTDNQDEVIAASESMAENAIMIGRSQRTEVDRIAFTEGVPLGIALEDGVALQPLIEPLAALAGLDLVVLSNSQGQEIIGLQRVVVSGSIDYAVFEETDLTNIPAVQAILAGGDSASAIVTVDRRTMLVTAGTVLDQGQLIGVVIVGTDINRVLGDLVSGSNAQAALFAGDGQYLASSFNRVEDLMIEPAIYNATLAEPDQMTTIRDSVDDADYQVGYFPFVIGQTPLGVVAAYATDDTQIAAEFGRQLFSLFLAMLVAGVYIAGYMAASRTVGRLTRLRQSVDAMTAGEARRTGLKPTDEIGEIGVAVDRFAAAAQVHVRQLQFDVRQQRRQLSHLHGILESLSDGVVLQDADGRILTMNRAARHLLGVDGANDTALALRTWSAELEQNLADRLGDVLAPGLVAVNESTQFQIDDRIVHVSAAAVNSITDKHMGMVLTIRDVTHEVAEDARRDALLSELNAQQDALRERVQSAALDAVTRNNAGLQAFAKEIAGDARAMQRVITEYRDITLMPNGELAGQVTSVLAEDLLADLVEEWRTLATSAQLDIDVQFPPDDVQLLADGKRLLWALGNIVDNSIKYNDGAGKLSIHCRVTEQQSLIIKFSDTGIGIDPAEQSNVFSRFYRGKRIKPDGKRLPVPGAGQGLYIAKKIVEAHGGSIALASEVFEGTQVSVQLPLTAGAVPVSDAQISVWDMPTNTAISLIERVHDDSRN